MTANRLILLIAAACVLVVALISQGIFERIPHVEDEAAYWFQAQVFAGGRLSVPTPRHASAYWSPFVIDLNGQRFGKYPPGYPLLLSLGMLVGSPWLINALASVVTLVLLADLGRRIYSPTTGLLAAALGLICPALLVAASCLLSHAVSMCLAAVFMWAMARMDLTPRPPSLRGKGVAWAAVAGLALGYLFLTRPYDAIGVGLPFGVYTLARLLGRERRAWLTPALVLAAVAGLCALTLPLYWYHFSGDPMYDPYLAVFPYDRPGFGAHVGRGGYYLADAWFNLRHNFQRMATGLLGWPGYANVVFLVVPFLAAWWSSSARRGVQAPTCQTQRQPARLCPFPPARLRPFGKGETQTCGKGWTPQPHSVPWDLLLLGTFVSVAALYTTYWYYGGHDAGFPRYWLAALPALLLLTARGIDLLAHGLRNLGARCLHGATQQAPVVLLYLALVGMVVYNGCVFMPPELAVFRGRYGVTAAPLEVVRQAGVSNALVFVAGVEHWHDFAVFFSANSPTLDSNVVYAIYRDVQRARSVRALFPGRACHIQRAGRLEACGWE